MGWFNHQPVRMPPIRPSGDHVWLGKTPTLPGGSAGGQLWRSTCTSVLPQTVVVAGKWAKVMGEKQARLLVEAGKDGYSV